MNNEIKTQQQTEFLRALKRGKLRELVELKGGTGEKRRELSAKEKVARKARRKQAKLSRKMNRKGA